ncbi:hypothetical protein [Sphingomonas sp. LM7]|uniref:hypothetical protein n=1 Tax=Sphingomonas sp. LM7 TaxID=1938607 RepID=UPI00098399D6|nr:hypothetical protein [Sphingomonas sp. LM7]AQR75078.1 hypothetical protein BXU08_16690 [Sphingomonas sp. LM7]
MENPLRRLMMLPVPAIMVVVTLALFVPACVYFEWSLREWQIGGSPAALLTERFFWSIWLVRGVGAVLLAILLLYWRHPGAIAVTVTASWLAGPPLTFLLKGIAFLAASAGQSSWSGGLFDWIVPAALLPSIITAALLIPWSVRAAFAIS